MKNLLIVNRDKASIIKNFNNSNKLTLSYDDIINLFEDNSHFIFESFNKVKLKNYNFDYAIIISYFNNLKFEDLQMEIISFSNIISENGLIIVYLKYLDNSDNSWQNINNFNSSQKIDLFNKNRIYRIFEPLFEIIDYKIIFLNNKLNKSIKVTTKRRKL